MTVFNKFTFLQLSATSAPLRESSFRDSIHVRNVQITKAWRPSAALFMVLAIVGCAEPTTGVVTGTVTVDGTPAKEGSIAFFPVDRKSSTAGAAIADGKYTATVPLGQMKVEIRVPRVVGQKKLYDTPDSPLKPLMAESLPPKYNDASELTLDVQPGENQQDYELATK
jgi:hypothetical protein